jgi:hypothetical protein
MTKLSLNCFHGMWMRMLWKDLDKQFSPLKEAKKGGVELLA